MAQSNLVTSGSTSPTMFGSPSGTNPMSLALNSRMTSTPISGMTTPSYNPTPTTQPITHVQPTIHPSTITTTDPMGGTTKSTYDTSGLLGTLNNIKSTAQGIQGELNNNTGGNGIMNGQGQQGGVQGTFTNGQFTPNPNTGTPVAGQTQDQANIAANPSTYLGGQQTSGTSQPTYPGLIGQLTNTSQAGNPTVSSAENQLNSANYPGLLASAQSAQQRAVDINQALNEGINDQALRGTPLNFVQGEQAALQRDYGAQATAASQEAQNALALAQTGQQGVTSAGQLGNQAQGLTQSGLTSAAQLGQPSPAQYGQTVFNPLTGQYSGGSSGVSPSDPFYQTLQSYAQMAANGQIAQVPSSITGNAVLNAQMNQMAQQINPSYNPVTSAAQSAITTQQTGNVATMTAAYKSAANLGSQLKDLITTYGVNPADLNAANLAIQKVAQNTSSPQYQALNNLVTDLVATYSSILTPGASTDTARATAASLLNDSASGKSLITTLNNLDDQAKAKIAGQTTGYGETPGSTSSNSSGSSSTSGFGWNGN